MGNLLFKILKIKIQNTNVLTWLPDCIVNFTNLPSSSEINP